MRALGERGAQCRQRGYRIPVAPTRGVQAFDCLDLRGIVQARTHRIQVVAADPGFEAKCRCV